MVLGVIYGHLGCVVWPKFHCDGYQKEGADGSLGVDSELQWFFWIFLKVCV